MRLKVLVAGIGALFAITAQQALATTPPGKPGLVAYDRDPVSDFNEIWLMNADGSGQRQLTTPTGGASDGSPEWTPSGRQVFFTRFMTAQTDIYVINSDGSGLANLTQTIDPVFELFPASSPDGRTLAFARRSGGGMHDIWVMDLATTVQANITNTPTINETVPDFSPDGGTLLFRRCAPACNFWAANPDGSNARPVTNTPSSPPFYSDPVFSRDGLRIGFVDGPGPNSISLMNIDGTGAAPLTPSNADVFSPDFTADGGAIGFGRCTSGCDIFTVPVGGGAILNLTNSPGVVGETSPAFHAVQTCGKKPATIVGDNGPDQITGSKRGDVIDANSGKNKVSSGGGNDTICAGKKAKINCGGGKKDRVIGKYQRARKCERGKGL